MLEIHQVLVSASPGDAVTHSALEIRSLLQRITQSEIYVRHRDPALQDEVRLLDEYPAAASKDTDQNILIYHSAIGDPDLVAFLMGRPERLVLVYHNITPSHYFQAFDPRFALALEQGRLELGVLRERTTAAIADSKFNARELEELGYRHVRVSPVLTTVGSLALTPPDYAVRERLRPDAPVVLCVAQLLPHKRYDLLLETHHVLTTHLIPEAQLVMVGGSPLPWYVGALDRIAFELNLQGVWRTGRVSDRQLAAFYRLADVFVTMSEHEGFCVPLLEAMSFEVPIVARSWGAIPETLGDAGVLLPASSGPILAAEAIAEAVSNPGLRTNLVNRGIERLESFHPEEARATFLRHLLEVV